MEDHQIKCVHVLRECVCVLVYVSSKNLEQIDEMKRIYRKCVCVSVLIGMRGRKLMMSADDDGCREPKRNQSIGTHAQCSEHGPVSLSRMHSRQSTD